MQSRSWLEGSQVDLVSEVAMRREMVQARVQEERRKQWRDRVGVNMAIGAWAIGMAVAIVWVVISLGTHPALRQLPETLRNGNASELDAVATTLSVLVERGEEDAPGALAVLEAHRYLEGAVPPGTVDEAVAAAERAGDAQRAATARAIVAAVVDPTPPASAVAEADDDREDLDAWLMGLRALASDDEAQRGEAIARLQALELRSVRASRVLAGLLADAGRFDEVEMVLLQHREQAEPAIDLALFDGVTGRNLDRAERTIEGWLAKRDELSPRTQARMLVARGAARLHRGRRAEALTDFADALPRLPAWDQQAVDLALEALLSHVAIEAAEPWIARFEPAPGWRRDVRRAWLSLARGEVGAALTALGQAPQEQPRVAYLQALALVEQQRWLEASAWLQRAMALLPERGELRIADARVRLRLGAVGEAGAALIALSEAYPWAEGVWTGLAESQQLVRADRKTLEATLRRALERESRPAEAAEMLATLLEDKPEQRLELLARAVELTPGVGRYRVALGELELRLGRLAEAEASLREACKDPNVPPEGPLLLSRIVVERSIRARVVPPVEVSQWLALATQRGAEAGALQRETARFELATGQVEAARTAVNRLTPLVREQPRDVLLAALYIRALGRAGRPQDAVAAAKTRLRRTSARRDGPLLVAWAEVERMRGHTREAAKLAFRGTSKLAEQDYPADVLLWGALLTNEAWIALDQPSGARAVGRMITAAAPLSPEAWAIRAEIQHLTGFDDFACESVQTAKSLYAATSVAKELEPLCAPRAASQPS